MKCSSQMSMTTTEPLQCWKTSSSLEVELPTPAPPRQMRHRKMAFPTFFS